MAKSISVKRQSQALQTIIQAILFALIPVALPWVWGLAELGPLPNWLAPITKFLPWACWGWSLLLLGQAGKLWQSASKANRGTGAFLPAELQPLEQQGWQLSSTAVEGDGQVVAQSPSGKVYCIVLKRDRGRVGTDGKQVFRLYDNAPQAFSADFIAQTKQRAAQVKQQTQANQVVPVLAFTEAIVNLNRNSIAGVKVVAAAKLRQLLLQQER